MTNQEAIEILKIERDHMTPTLLTEHIEAIDMAISALQAQELSETQKALDTISRQAAIDHWRLIIDATNTDSRYNMGFADGLEFCINDLITMPSAQPERKKGKWIQISPAKIYECSVCAQNVMTNDIYCYTYCHNCGCMMNNEEWADTGEVVEDMRGEQDEEAEGEE